MTDATCSKAILVLGMHRSGTSALTGVLNVLGTYVGEALIPASSKENPKGFWEHVGIVDLHERLLSLLGSSWNDERNLPEHWWLKSEVRTFRDELEQIVNADFAGHGYWAVKDPRMCRLMPLWCPLFEASRYSPKVILILRDPREVAKSLATRDEMAEERSHLLWLQHVIDAERWTRGYPRVLITFEELLENWCGVVEEICKKLQLDLPFKDSDMQSRIDTFLEPALRHHSIVKEPAGRLSNLALATYQACINSRSSGRLEVALAPLASEVRDLADLVSFWSVEIQALWRARSKLATSEATVAGLTKEIDRIKHTVSWRVTAPLRAAWNFCAKLFGGK